MSSRLIRGNRFEKLQPNCMARVVFQSEEVSSILKLFANDSHRLRSPRDQPSTLQFLLTLHLLPTLYLPPTSLALQLLVQSLLTVIGGECYHLLACIINCVANRL